MRIIYAEFLAGLSYTAIAKKLTELGIKSPAGNDVWNNSTVKSILSKPSIFDLLQTHPFTPPVLAEGGEAFRGG